MKGEEGFLINFLDGSKKRFIIPVYQRNYNWKHVQCEQLFSDLTKVIEEKRKSHFFGSIVFTRVKKSIDDSLIIDGQQRITTISLLFTAMVNLLRTGEVISEDENLAEDIEETYLIIKRSKSGERKLRLKPIKDDCEAFDRLLLNDENSFLRESNITANYKYFIKALRGLQEKQITIDELYDAIKKLEIISIFVEDDEDPQRIFESLNSTGLALTEADKIRNFILMRLDSEKQELFYEKYWNKIEKLTCLDGTKNDNVSDFIRHYLTFRIRRIPKIEEVYSEFKEHVENNRTSDGENILQDMLAFAQIYNKVINSSFSSRKISQVLKRLNHIEMTVLYPFFLAFFEMYENQKVSEDETVKVLKCIESFIFRRIICPGYATNALNKIFCTLHFDVMKKMEEAESYSEILIHVLESKTGSSGFPKDSEFIQALKSANIYKMQKKNKEYLFERLENEDSVEYVNVIELMNDNERENRLTIEHIMPQTLSQQWRISLGENSQEIYDSKLHTLGNLTLTGYNAKYSNRTFIEKRDCEKGYKERTSA